MKVHVTTKALATAVLVVLALLDGVSPAPQAEDSEEADDADDDTSGMNKDMKAIQTMFRTCLEETGVKIKLFISMMNESEPISDKGAEMALCLFRAFDFLDENNQYSKEAVLELAFRINKDSPRRRKLIEHIAGVCERDARGDSAEEVAKNLFECFRTQIHCAASLDLVDEDEDEQS
ncbi:uncharacterized protein LOC117643478 isoform X2 [Thrips palmi]|uniref:Uncharacterized protein LOC117643478 isoform X2 n=1 Tax=Thrips palmi TaxID=161013 RepID=A0A6P8YN81_THRPL|nr:uncharacterized protein LOC117643478 isoform X2 [Thrips palmi]